jgi:hypothetical protein
MFHKRRRGISWLAEGLFVSQEGQGPMELFFSHGVKTSPLGTAATVWPIVPAPGDR